MKKKLESLRRLKWLRERQRDGAAQERGAAQRSLAEALAGLDDARAKYVIASRKLSDEVTNIERVTEIELLRAELDATRREILTSQHLASAAKMHVDARSAELGRKERALRSCERLLADAEVDAERERDRREQRENDDRMAARKARSA